MSSALRDRPERSGEGEGPSKPAEPAAPAMQAHERRQRMRLAAGGALIAILALGAFAYWLYARRFESTDDAFIEAHVTPVSPKVAAHVERLLVDDNEDVERGRLLLELDRRDFEVRLAQERARLEASRSRLASADAGVVRANAEVEAANADVVAAQSESERTAIDLRRHEAAGAAVTRQSLDNARALAASTAAQLHAARDRAAAARSQVPVAEAQVAVDRAEIEQSTAQLREAELQLSYTEIRAPVAGRVTRRSVEVGAYVQPGDPLFALVEKEVWVLANFRETQLTHMRPGQPVEVEIDAYPDRPFKAKVDSVQRGTGARFSLIPPENATGNYVKVVQRVPVKIVFVEPLPRDVEMGAGLSVVPTVRVR
jgi:membrane fusion protein (multidrug efflux system)